MEGRKRTHSGRECRAIDTVGFTLIEVTFAILILSGALVVLLGLQSSVVARTIRDSKRQQAMLYARQILAALEMSEFELELEEMTGTVQEVLELTGTFDPQDERAEAFEQASDMLVHYSVEPWGISPEQPEAMKRVRVAVSWGETSDDRIEVLYFAPYDQEPEIDPTNDDF